MGRIGAIDLSEKDEKSVAPLRVLSLTGLWQVQHLSIILLGLQPWQEALDYAEESNSTGRLSWWNLFPRPVLLSLNKLLAGSAPPPHPSFLQPTGWLMNVSLITPCCVIKNTTIFALAPTHAWEWLN